MAFVDEISIHLKAGDGGHGVVRWLHEKGKEYMGPAGGNGGRGGGVFVEGTRDIGILTQYRNVKKLEAGRAGDGGSSSMHGKDGEPLIVKLPIGSVITNKDTGMKVELLSEGERIHVLAGGAGGLGNEYFKGSTNVTPEQSTDGKQGDEADFYIELKLIVDSGLVGFPNAGKSSLLNSITNANAKIGAYQFTTLEPNLGSLYGFIIADIPGLIEGASEGKGLGHKFLRHISRTKMLVHLVSLENEDITNAYKTIRKELETFGEGLSEKKEIIILTKTDLVDEKTLKAKVKEAKKLNPDVFVFSIINDEQIKLFGDELVKILRGL